jgi:hypothetical protein
VDSDTSASYIPSNQELIVGASSTGSGGEYFNGSIDELKYISPSLNSGEIRNEYLYGRPFIGEYSSRSFVLNKPEKYQFVKTSSNISSGDSSINVSFQSSNDGFNTMTDTQTVSLNGGNELFNVGLQDAAEARILVEGLSRNVTETWTLDSVKAEF